MLCNNCGKREATFHCRQIINGEKSEQHLCSECARELGYMNSQDSIFGQSGMFDFSSILSDFLSLPSFAQASIGTSRCPSCSTTLDEFRKTGLLGCDRCYDEFENIVESTLSSIQPSTVHKGRIAGKNGKKIQKKNELDEMKEQLKRAILDEKYEEAAVLRDKIKEAESKTDKTDTDENKED